MTPSAHPQAHAGYPNIAQLAQLAGMPVWIFDLEATTGDLKDPQFGIVEIGWVRVHPDGAFDEGALLTNPGHPMNPYAAKLTGISTSLYANAPTLEALWPDISPLMFGSLCSGFGIHDLDCKALFNESTSFLGDEAGRRPRIHSLDARGLWMEHNGSPKGQLAEVAKHFGHEEPGMHRALADSRACARALDGLILAMGAAHCFAKSRMSWNPLEAMDKAAELAAAAEASLDAVLALCKGCGDFDRGLDILDQAGARCHYSSKGFAWYVDGVKAKSPSAPSSPNALAAHFGSRKPRRICSPDTLTRCEAVLNADPALSDERAALLSLCRSAGSCAAARARAIRSGSLPPWTGVSPDLRSFAESTAPADLGGEHAERMILDALRLAAPPSFLDKHSEPALSACAASLWAIRTLAPSRPGAKL